MYSIWTANFFLRIQPSHRPISILSTQTPPVPERNLKTESLTAGISRHQWIDWDKKLWTQLTIVEYGSRDQPPALLDKIKVHLKPNVNPAIHATWDKLADLQVSNCDRVMDMAAHIRNANKEFQRFGIKFPEELWITKFCKALGSEYSQFIMIFLSCSFRHARQKKAN